MDLVNKLLELLGGQSPMNLVLLAIGAYLVLGGKIDLMALWEKLKGILPKAVTVVKDVTAGDGAADRLAAAHLIRAHLKAVGAPQESIDAFNTHIAPHMWDNVDG